MHPVFVIDPHTKSHLPIAHQKP